MCACRVVYGMFTLKINLYMYFSLLIIDLALIQILPEAMFVRNIECVSDSLWTMCWTAVQQFNEYLNQLWGNKFLLKNNSNLVKSSWANLKNNPLNIFIKRPICFLITKIKKIIKIISWFWFTAWIMFCNEHLSSV